MKTKQQHTGDWGFDITSHMYYQEDFVLINLYKKCNINKLDLTDIAGLRDLR